MLLSALVLLSILWLRSTSQAQSTCDPLVLDVAGVFRGDIGQVQSAAEELVRSGADVRVRTIRSYGAAGNLDRYESQVEAGCPSWQAPDGSTKNNLIVLIAAVEDRATGLYYGAQWSRALDTEWPRISSEVINPRFRDGDFAGGFVKGMAEIKRTVQSTGAPGAAGRSGSGGLALAVLAAALVLGVAFLGYRLLAARKRDRERRRAAQRKARLAKQGAASRITELPERLQMLEIKVGAVKDQTVEEDSASLVSDLAKVKGQCDAAAATYADLAHSAGDPGREGLSVAEYGAIEEAYRRVLEKLHEAETLLNALEQRSQAFWQTISDLPAKLSDVEESIRLAGSAVMAAQAQGFKTVGSEAFLTGARSLLEQARALHRERRPKAALEGAGKATELASQAATSAERLPQMRDRTMAGTPVLAARIERVQRLIEEGADVFERISRSYAETSWQSIEGNGTEATNRVDWSLQSLEDIKKAGEEQDWQAAFDFMTEVNAWLDEAGSLIESIKVLEDHLADAKRDAPLEIDLAQTDITRAWQYINAYDEDIRESLEDDLRQAEQGLEKARQELARDMPDFLLALGAAKSANDAADKVLEQARSEHEAAERLRARVASSLRDARMALSRAQQYVRDHRSDVGSPSISTLEKAQRFLTDAEAVPDLSAKVGAADRAQSAANEAYATAQSDVSEAQEARERRYMRTGGGPVFPVPFPPPGRPTTWGRPSPRPPGMGGFGRGGGSIGWGGGRRGGGSTKW